MAGERLPIIDLAGFDTASVEAKARLAAELDEVFRTVGFCYIVNHSVPLDAIERAFTLSRDFLMLPLARKSLVATNASGLGYRAPAVRQKTFMAYNPDGSSGSPNATNENIPSGGKENFVFTRDPADAEIAANPLVAVNSWPDFMPEFRKGMYAYFEEFSRVGGKLLELVAMALGSDPRVFSEKFRTPTSLCSTFYYPPLSDEALANGYVSLPEHCDYSCLTLLVQDSVGGLEVKRRDGGWIEAPPIPGSLVLNVGDLLARWSNDRYVSTPHRVMNRTGKARQSMPVFYNPDSQAVIDPRELGVDDTDSLYPPVTAGDYQRSRLMESNPGANDPAY